MTNYILRQGTDAYRRLTLLAEAKWPSTSALFERLPVRPGMKCMDVGSGTGAVSLALARIVAPTGRVVGVDTDTLLLDLAREKAAEEELPAEFLEIDVTKSELPRGFDLVYARFLLTHLRSPLQALEKMRRSTVGGVIVVEDIDFDGHVCYPHCAAFDRYVELYKGAARSRGADPLIGPKLPGLLEAAGCTRVELEVVTPTFRRGEQKLVAAITMEHIREAVVGAGLASHGEVDDIVDELTAFARRSDTIISLARIFQAVGWG
jgi:SAM-dependent methyltransferase